jgi:putative PIN family toxin of toxin-antitoxin system
MNRVVLDVNVIVSAFPSPDGVPATIVRFGLSGAFAFVMSEHILRGVERAWNKPYFREKYSDIEARIALRTLRQRTIIVEPSRVAIGVADDLEDDLVLGTAIAGQADYLVTGDRGLLKLEKYLGIGIVPPQEFLFTLL